MSGNSTSIWSNCERDPLPSWHPDYVEHPKPGYKPDQDPRTKLDKISDHPTHFIVWDRDDCFFSKIIAEYIYFFPNSITTSDTGNVQIVTIKPSQFLEEAAYIDGDIEGSFCKTKLTPDEWKALEYHGDSKSQDALASTQEFRGKSYRLDAVMPDDRIDRDFELRRYKLGQKLGQSQDTNNAADLTAHL